MRKLMLNYCKSSKVGSRRDWLQGFLMFRAKTLCQRVKIENMRQHVSLSDEWSWLDTLKFFSVSYSSYQPLNFLRYLILSMQYAIFI